MHLMKSIERERERDIANKYNGIKNILVLINLLESKNFPLKENIHSEPCPGLVDYVMI